MLAKIEPKNKDLFYIEAGYNGLAVSTQKAYTTDLNIFYSIINKDITAINPVDVNNYVKALESKGYKNSTINRKIYSISKALNLYKLAGIIDRNPIIELNQIKSITRSVSNQVDTQIDVNDLKIVLQKRNKTTIIIKVLANTGLRISELIGIKNKDIDDYKRNGRDYKKIRIVGKRNKERFIYLAVELFNEIKNIFNSDCKYLFHSSTGKILNRVNLHKQIKQVFKRYTGKVIHPHCLRHFFATYKINNEKRDIKAVSKYLGHSKTSITLDMYVDTALDPENTMIIT